MKFLLLFLLALSSCSTCSPMDYDHGVPNLDQVDVGVWRSGQISTQAGWDWVKLKTHAKRLHVIKLNLDTEGSDALAVAAGIDVHVLAIQPEGDQGVWDDLKSVFKQPDPAIVAQAEALLATATVDDVWLVHCTHGQDRTGYVIGVYRVLQGHWTKAVAYQEMLAHHFHPELHGVHEAWEDFQR